MTAKERYQEFLKTPFWKDISRRKLAQVGHCEECGYHLHLQAHHLFYRKNWFDTQLEDLQVLCRTCHRIEHGRSVKFPFDIVTDGIERALNQAVRGAKLPCWDNFRVAAALVLVEEDERQLAALIRNRSGLRMILKSSTLWERWLKNSRDTKRKFFAWSQIKAKNLIQEASYVG